MVNLDNLKTKLVGLHEYSINNNIKLAVDAECMVSTSCFIIDGIMCEFLSITSDSITCVVKDIELTYKKGVWL